MAPETLKLPSYKKEADCCQFLCLRSIMSVLYGMVMFGVVFIYGLMIGVTSFINCFTVICTKTNWETHYNVVAKLSLWQAHMGMYLTRAVDETPSCCP